MIEALCIGHAAWDVSVWVPGYPQENSKCEVQHLVECSGGPAANAACLLARWGVRTAFVGRVGADAYGERILASLKQSGVDVSGVSATAEAVTPVSVILVNETNASRTIVNRNRPVAAGEPLEHFDTSLLAPRLLLFDGHELAASLAALERWPEAISVLDAGSLRPGTEVLAGKVKCLAASERFARQVSGVSSLETAEGREQALRVLSAMNGHEVVITLGERGLFWGSSGHAGYLPAYPVSAVDTTGAGDIFHGALAFGLLRGKPWEETLRIAAMAAALSVQTRGSSTSIPSLASVVSAMELSLRAPEAADRG